MSSGSDCAWIDYIVFPYPLPPVTPPYQTEFEELGSIPEEWHNDTGDDFNWLVNSGGTPSNNTGPSGDHTTGSGYYMYTEATDPNNPYKRADLITPNFDLSSLTDVEVRFWYHMYDNTANNYMGMLHLDIYHNETWTEDIMTAVSGNQGNQWHEQIVDLTTYAGETIKLRFRGITGAGYASDIAIDDFSIDGSILAPEYNVELTAFLEGPYNGLQMSTTLNQLDLLPTDHPYGPWGHTGTESADPIPNGDIVDWILVDFRETTGGVSTATAATSIETHAAFLKMDGTIVGMDGMSPITLYSEVTSNLFVAIQHRNHLGIISSVPLSLDGDSYTYSFSSGSGQAYGTTSAQNNLGSGVWGMKAGDGDGNGLINDLDHSIEWTNEAGKSGYLGNDYNMDGQADNPDKDDFWLNNNPSQTYIPE